MLDRRSNAVTFRLQLLRGGNAIWVLARSEMINRFGCDPIVVGSNITLQI